MRLRTSCNRDCPDACSLEAEVVDGRLISLRGASDDPVTKGFLCPRTTRFVDRQNSTDRLRTPLRRLPGSDQFEEVSWDEALDLAARKLREAKADHGAESILHYKSGGSLGYLKLLTSVFFEEFGPVCVKRGDICSGAGEWAQSQDFGVSDSSEPEDLLKAKLIVIWGKNIHTSSVHLLPTILEAKKRGAIIVGIDPVRTRAARICDLFLCPRPGADAQLALALVSYLHERDRLDPDVASYCNNLAEFLKVANARTFEERISDCGLSLDDGYRFAELYDQNRPSSILIGWGAPRRLNGALTVRAIDGLAAVSGNVGVAGACASFYFQRKRSLSRENLPAPKTPPRTFSETRLGKEMEAANPGLRLVWVTAGNPVAMLPDSQTVAEQLRAIDFTIVVDTHHTDTTACADLVLPTLTLVEDEDLVGAYGNPYLRSSQPVVEPYGEARHELWIHQQLANRLGFGKLLEGSPKEWKERLLSPEVDRAVLEGKTVRQPGAPKVVFEGRKFLTSDGRVHLLSEQPPLPAEQGEGFPWKLMAVSHPDAQSSQWSVEPPELPQARISDKSPATWIHGEVVRLETRHGGFRVLIAREEGIHPELIVLPKGGSGLFGGWCPNDLIEAVETDYGGGASYYDEPARLVKL